MSRDESIPVILRVPIFSLVVQKAADALKNSTVYGGLGIGLYETRLEKGGLVYKAVISEHGCNFRIDIAIRE